MTRINTNVESLRGLHNIQKSQAKLSSSLQRLSTGLAINNGRDNPAGLIASEGLRLQITTIEQSIKNSNRANNVLATADSALGEIGGLLNQVRGLVQEALNSGALSDDEIKANQGQIDQALSAINRISSNTSFGGQKLIDGSKAFQTSSTAVDSAKINDLQINEALFGTSNTIAVNATVTAAAQQGELRYNGGTLSSATTLEVGGSKGNQVLFLGGTSTVANIRDAVNAVSDVTGVNATLRAGLEVGGGTAGTAVAANLTYNSVSAVAGVTGIAASRTFAAGADSITVTADATGTAGNAFTVAFVAGVGNNVALSSAISGNAITVTLGTDGTGALDSTLNTANLVAASVTALAGVSATSSGNTTGFTASAAANLTGGVTAVTAVTAENITFTAADAGFDGNNLRIVVQTGGANAATASTVSGITTLTLTKTAADTSASFSSFINGNSTASALVSAAGAGTTTIGNNLASTALTGGVDGTGGAVKITDARTEGSAGTISVVFADPGANSAALSISTSAADVNGNRTITVNLATNGSGAIISTADDIAAALEADATATTLVNAKSTTDGVVSAAASAALTQGDDAELVLKSANFGSNEFVQLNVLSGSFSTTLNDSTTVSLRDAGTDIEANINGQAALGDGLTAIVKNGLLDASISFTAAANVAATTAAVTITGGGSLFQIGQQADASGQIGLGIDAINTARLGGISGKLYELGTGGGKSLLDVGPNVPAIDLVDILEQALNRVNTLRGRLGAIQKNVIDTNISNLGVALENISSARSQIVDTDFAAETAAMQKAQVLSQAGISVLTIANQVPQQVLSLLR